MDANLTIDQTYCYKLTARSATRESSFSNILCPTPRQPGLPVGNATFDLAISGQAAVSITSAPSDASGIAEAVWTTQAPNRKGQGGTASGSYVATVSGLNAGGFSWNKLAVQVNFNITPK